MVKIQKLILLIIDWFHQPFKKYIPIQTFRYALTGGANTAFDIFLYFINYNFVLKKKVLDLKIISVSPHISAFLMSFSVTFLTGFFLAKYITFQNSFLRGRIQLFRYFVTVMVCILLNYIFIKFFVEVCHLFPTPSKTITTIIVVIYSYFSQKYFSFQTKKAVITQGSN